MSTKGYDVAPVFMPDSAQHRRKLGESLKNAMAGKINATTSVTLTANATSTTLIDNRIGANTHITFSPRTADAVTAQISGLYVASKKAGHATLAHASSANTDQTFDVLLIG